MRPQRLTQMEVSWLHGIVFQNKLLIMLVETKSHTNFINDTSIETSKFVDQETYRQIR